MNDEETYVCELAGAPENRRESLVKLSAGGDWTTRLTALRQAKALIPATDPVTGLGTDRPDVRRMSWNTAWARHMEGQAGR